mmetsp:Transcript_85014/g.189980  ORF Transcript_85014/g.189980 Transcript_85014/m.189980 type:complete len:208 (-) Transcript_85014:86-709(-)
MAIWQTSPVFFVASRQRDCTTLSSRPTSESIFCFPISAASCMASPRSFTSRRASSKPRTPAAQRAEYSPREKPAMTDARVTLSGSCWRSFSTEARPAMNMAGWQYFVSSSFSSGPSWQSSSTSYPKIFSAFSNISWTLGKSFTPSSILTYCEPCPGKMRPTGSGGLSSGPTDVGAGGRGGFCWTTRSRPLKRTLTQPSSGPSPSFFL